MRSAENVLKELDEIKRLGYGAFTFLDDNFLLKPERAEKICDGMVSRGHSFRWACEGRAEGQTLASFGKLRAAGCDLVMFGVESGSQRVLDGMKKRTKLAEIEEAVNSAWRSGIGILHGFFIVGSPGETIQEVEATFKFAERLPINSFNFNSLTAFRGTALWKDAVAKRLIDDDADWEKAIPIHTIYPDCIDTQTLFRFRSRMVKRLIVRKIVRHPFSAVRIMARFLNCMSLVDLYRLCTSSKSKHTRQ